MEWKLEKNENCIVVNVCSNPVNKQNPEFIRDLNQAFDHLDKEYPHMPVILTAQGKVFSAGFDFDYVLPVFDSGDAAKVNSWFGTYRQAMLRIFQSPRMTIAAVNGHAFAGGLIFALCCDFRVAEEGDARYSLNEVPIGIPMPSVYTEIVRFRLGNRMATEMILSGNVYNAPECLQSGVFGQLAPSGKLLDRAIETANLIPRECWEAFAHTKRGLHYPVIQAIESYSPELDKEGLQVLMSAPSRRARSQMYHMLKAKKPLSN